MNPPTTRPATFDARVWQLDAAAHLLATLDERYAALRVALRVPAARRHAFLAQLDAADAELCVARAGFLDAVCQLHLEKAATNPARLLYEHMFDALDVLWDFEAAWENALDKASSEDDPTLLALKLEVENQETNHEP